MGSYGADGTVEIFSIVVASSKKHIIPDALRALCYIDEKGTHLPFESDVELKEELIKKKRKAKGTGVAKKVNIRTENEKKKKARQLPKLGEYKAPEKPFYLYVDVIAKKSEILIGQTSGYVEIALEKLMTSGIFELNGIKHLCIWSDGCGKVSSFSSFILHFLFIYFNTLKKMSI